MASGRFLSTSIADDERLSRLSLMAEFIYLKTIPHLDRDGMITGKPGLLYSRVCPAREELFGGLLTLINEWVAVGLVVRFDGPEGAVLFFPGFLKNNKLAHYDRERASKFPAPPGYIRTKDGLAPASVNEPVNDTSQDTHHALVQDEVQELIQDEVQDIDLQEQEQEEDQVKDQDQPKLEDEEDARACDPVEAAWLEIYGTDMPENLLQSMNKLIAECGEDAVIHGIQQSAGSKSRSFKYIAQCARNYIPPAPPPENSNYTKNGNGRYSVDIPGVVAIPASPRNMPPLPPPMAHADPWQVGLDELSRTLPPRAVELLEGSRLVANGELAGVPFYQVVVVARQDSADWLKRQVEPAIRKKVASVVGHRVEIDIVAAQGEPA